jgi:peptidoglycan/xylan/chitin deacetylase (PgdA/CDA1 family)
MMSSEQVAALASRGFAVGGHTATHPILARLPVERARDEIDRGRRRLEALSGKRVSLFAYPNGRPDHDYTMATVGLVRDAGFDAAVCTSAGAARVGSDVYQIPRFTPWDKRRPAFAARMWSNLTRTAPVRATA